MEVLVLDGKNFVKASKAARELGYATDYVGQLCRSNQVEAHLIGRTWYVNQEQLGTHRVEKKRMSRVKAREHAKKSIEEHRQKTQNTQNFEKRIQINYESDTEELIPETRRISVQPAAMHKDVSAIDETYSKTTIENKGEKVVMSGDITVVDVTDEPIETDVITLTPTHIRATPHKAKQKYQKNQPESEEEKVHTQENVAHSQSFTERLKGIEEPQQKLTDYAQVQDATSNAALSGLSSKKRPSLLVCALLLLFVAVLATATLPTTLIFTYSADNTLHVEQTLKFSIDDFLSKIPYKI